ncbi:hypothetical protein H2248_007969 [Termitomyces sp. 'cryptogamus']|nr:hypothetical protein H2248_007969 [Termitomyces sp. 'cryptogamus']
MQEIPDTTSLYRVNRRYSSGLTSHERDRELYTCKRDRYRHWRRRTEHDDELWIFKHPSSFSIELLTYPSQKTVFSSQSSPHLKPFFLHIIHFQRLPRCLRCPKGRFSTEILPPRFTVHNTNKNKEEQKREELVDSDDGM